MDLHSFPESLNMVEGQRWDPAWETIGLRISWIDPPRSPGFVPASTMTWPLTGPTTWHWNSSRINADRKHKFKRVFPREEADVLVSSAATQFPKPRRSRSEAAPECGFKAQLRPEVW